MRIEIVWQKSLLRMKKVPHQELKFGPISKEQSVILCVFSAYMHQKRREWEKKQKKFKNVANFNVPVLFASSEGLYLRLIDDEFGPGTEQNNEIENAVSRISILFSI